MTLNGICKACGKDLDANQFVAMCACGWHDSAPNKEQVQKAQMRMIQKLAGCAALLLVGVLHFGKWGGDGFAILPLKAANSIGLLGVSGTQHLVKVCMRHGDLECADRGFQKLSALANGNKDILQRAAHFHHQVKNHALANSNYDTYVKAGGRDYDALEEYGRSLVLAGDNTKAKEIFQLAIDNADKATLPVRATRGLLQVLIEEKNEKEARDIILAFRKGDHHGERYFEAEWKLLEPSEKSKGGAGTRPTAAPVVVDFVDSTAQTAPPPRAAKVMPKPADETPDDTTMEEASAPADQRQRAVASAPSAPTTANSDSSDTEETPAPVQEEAEATDLE
ncbi:MAG: hypothetical protein NDI61_04055 [Bdellovibrionaceae bacterium]|nr:hypothetical protein [Pseudobdellovibrionaceae bacterium]